MQPDNDKKAPEEKEPVRDDGSLDEAERRSEKAWEKADEAVEDLKDLGHPKDDDEGP
jgi:hypothetical protein